MTEAAVKGRIAHTAYFYSVNKDGEMIGVSPPLEVVRDVMAQDLAQFAKEQGINTFPPVQAITEIPVLRPDWSVLCQAGYDPTTHLYYAPAAGLTVPEVPAQPTKAQAERAIALIEEAIGEFPYETEADRANAFAVIITLGIRQAIKGKVPLALADAPRRDPARVYSLT